MKAVLIFPHFLFLVFFTNVNGQTLQITDFNPKSGPINTTVTITGSGFSAVATNNAVFFGLYKATVISAKTTQLSVNVPAGAALEKISVIVNGARTESKLYFTLTYKTTTCISAGSFAPFVNYSVGDPNDIVKADVNNDNKLDIVTCSFIDSSISILLGKGDGTFQTRKDFKAPKGPYSIASGDVNMDGKADIVTGNRSDTTISVYLGNGDGTFQVAKTVAASRSITNITLKDFNEDNKLDMVVLNLITRDMSVFLGIGDGTFVSKGKIGNDLSFVSILAEDFTGDNHIDLVVMDLDSILLFAGRGDGTFATVRFLTYNPNATQLVAYDFNRDGNIDFASSNQNGSNNVAVVLNKGNGSFQVPVFYPLGSGGYSLALGDFDGNSLVDLVACNRSDGTVSVLVGKGDGSFQSKMDFLTGGLCDHVLVSDFNGDGLHDVASISEVYEKPAVSILINKSGKSVVPTVKVLGTDTICKGRSTQIGFEFTGIRPWRVTYDDHTGSMKEYYGSTNPFYFQVTPSADTTYSITSFSDSSQCAGGGVVLGNAKVSLVNCAPSIAAISPTQGPSGTLVTITGTRFDPVLVNNKVTINGLLATVVSASSTQLVVKIPSGVTIDRLKVAVNGFVAMSNQYFHVITSSCTSPLLWNSPSGYYTAATPGTIRKGDVNKDGLLDVVVAANDISGEIAVHLAQSDGTFLPKKSLITWTDLNSFVLVDFNGDSILDIATSHDNETTPFFVGLGKGDGTFTSLTVPSNGYATNTDIAAGDFNQDGKMDVMFTLFLDPAIAVSLGNGDGTFSGFTKYQVGYGPDRVLVKDINGDNKLDAIVGFHTGTGLSILIGNGNGSFKPVTGYATNSYVYDIAAADLNKDGKQDLVTANLQTNNISVLFGKGDTTFLPHVEFAVGKGPVSLLAEDFDGDGWIDIMTANTYENTISILSNAGNGTFKSPVFYSTGGSPYGLLRDDFSQDKIADILVTNHADNTLLVMKGTGQGKFLGRTDYTTTGTGNGLTTADFNRDAKMDLAVTNGTANTVSLFGGNGDGTLQTKKDILGVNSNNDILSEDINGDGIEDLIVTHTDAGLWEILGNGDGSFQTPQFQVAYSEPLSVKPADFDHDGKLDLAVVNGSNYGFSRILKGNGDGTFPTTMSSASFTDPEMTTTGDFNQDGYEDYVVTKGSASNFTMLLNKGNGQFSATDISLPDKAYTVTQGDFNHDTFLDLFVSSLFVNSHAYYVLLGKGDGTFQPTLTGSLPLAYDSKVGYLNGDNHLDVIVTDGQYVTLLAGNGDGTFQQISPFYLVGKDHKKLAITDLNGDGKEDIVTGNSGFISLLMNLDGNATVASLSGSQTILSGQTAHLALSLAGKKPWSVAYTDGTTTQFINGITTSSYIFDVSPLKTTTYSLVSVTDSSHCKGEMTVSGSAKVTVSTILDVDDLTTSFIRGWKVYPNPSKMEQGVWLQSNLPVEQAYVQVFDITQTMVWQGTANFDSQQSALMPWNQGKKFPSGVYMIRAQTGDEVNTIKWVVE